MFSSSLDGIFLSFSTKLTQFSYASFPVITKESYDMEKINLCHAFQFSLMRRLALSCDEVFIQKSIKKFLFWLFLAFFSNVRVGMKNDVTEIR